MIHSLSGGVIKKKEFNDFAKVKIIDSNLILWYKTEYIVNEGDTVLVPLGRENKLVSAIVVRVDKDVPYDVSPISPRIAKSIDSVIKHN